MDIKTILDLQAQHDNLLHAIDDVFLALKYPGRLTLKTDILMISNIHHEIDKLQKANSVFQDLLSAAQELAHLHACEQEEIASGQPTPQQWYQAVNNLNDAIEKVKQETI